MLTTEQEKKRKRQAEDEQKQGQFVASIVDGKIKIARTSTGEEKKKKKVPIIPLHNQSDVVLILFLEEKECWVRDSSSPRSQETEDKNWGHNNREGCLRPLDCPRTDKINSPQTATLNRLIEAKTLFLSLSLKKQKEGGKKGKQTNIENVQRVFRWAFGVVQKSVLEAGNGTYACWPPELREDHFSKCDSGTPARAYFIIFFFKLQRRTNQQNLYPFHLPVRAV